MTWQSLVTTKYEQSLVTTKYEQRLVATKYKTMFFLIMGEVKSTTNMSQNRGKSYEVKVQVSDIMSHK